MTRRPAPEQQVSHNDRAIEEDAHQDQSEVGEEIRETLSALMPWGVSILAHVALIVLAFFLVWQTIVQPPEPPVVPRLTASTKAITPPDHFEDVDQEMTSSDSTLAVETFHIDPVEIKTVGPTPDAIVLPPQGDLLKDLLKPAPKSKKRKPSDPKVFFESSATKVVFLIDASGSMVDVLPFVINELKRSVNEMQPTVVDGRKIDKKATVIFFSGKGVHEVPGGGSIKGLRTMTPKFKEQVREWVSLENFHFDTGGRGSAFVGDALARALSYKPELIILLSDNLTGGGQGATQHELMQDGLLELIRRHNKAQPPTKINTVQFLYEDPLVRAGLQGTLDRIAEETKGEPRFVGQKDLHLR